MKPAAWFNYAKFHINKSVFYEKCIMCAEEINVVMSSYTAKNGRKKQIIQNHVATCYSLESENDGKILNNNEDGERSTPNEIC